MMFGFILSKNHISNIIWKIFIFVSINLCYKGTQQLQLSSMHLFLNQIHHKNPDLVAKVDSFCQLQNALRDDIFKTIFKMSFCVQSCIQKLCQLTILQLEYWQQIFWLNYKRQTGIRKVFCGWPIQKSLSLKHRFKLA